MYTDLTELGNLIDYTSEFLITDEKWTVLYRNHALDFTEEQWARWSMLYREETVEEMGLSWEVADKVAGKYYNVRSFPDRSKGELRLIHHIYDVSDYALIFRELTAYSSEWKKLASCQDELIGNLSADPSRCLDVAIKYFSVPYAVLYLRVGGDEFLVVAVNVTEEEANEILSSWRKGLSKLNEDEETPECIIACGLSYQAAPYEFEKVMERADALMYEDKRRIKIARGDDPDQR